MEIIFYQTKMKKLVFILFMIGCTTTVFGQDHANSIAKSIVKSLKDPAKACTTDDGRDGTLKVTGRETTTTTTSGNSDTKNSGSNGYEGKIGTSGVNVNYRTNSGTSSNTQNQTTSTTVKITEKCFPDSY